MNYWTTKTGQQIAVEDLGAEHLSNILHMIRRINKDVYFMRISDCIEENREQLNLILGENRYIQKFDSIRDKLLNDTLDPYYNPFSGDIASEEWEKAMMVRTGLGTGHPETDMWAEEYYGTDLYYPTYEIWQ